MDNFIREEVKGKRSQDLPTYYRLNGAIYIAKIELVKQQKILFLSSNAFSFLTDKIVSIYIDNFLDMEFRKLEIEKSK